MSEKIHNIAMVIPSHPPYYNYVYNLLNNISKIIDIYIVFSNDSDYNNFMMKEHIKPIIIDDVSKTKSIITYKKFYALNKLKDSSQYDYFIVCDSEIDIVPENFNKENITSKIGNIYKNKTIYGCEINTDYAAYDIPNKIVRQCSQLFGPETEEKMKEITNNYNIYYWWSDIPTYKREHLEDFFSKMNYDNIDYYHFDHVIYCNYLMLYHDFKFLNMIPHLSIPLIKNKKLNASLEYFITNDPKDLDTLKENNYGFSWAFPVLFNQYRDFLVKEGTFLLYHINMKDLPLFIL